MKSVMNGNLKVWHLIVFGVALFLLGGGAVALADTDGIAAFWAQGTVRFNAASVSNAGTTVSIPPNQTEVLVSEVSLDVPSGKRADVQAFFNGYVQLSSTPTQFVQCFARIRLDSVGGAEFKPGLVHMIGGNKDNLPTSGIALSVNGWRKNVGQGTHKVQLYMSSTSNGCSVSERTFQVIANIR